MALSLETKEVLSIKAKYDSLCFCLTERSRRLWCASEATSYGYGGVRAVFLATGIAKTTILRGTEELKSSKKLSGNRMRNSGGGRKSLKDINKNLLKDLDFLVSPSTCGSPESPLIWSSKSTIKICSELVSKGHAISQRSVWNLLKYLGYSLQANRKTKEKADDPDRDKQFEYISKNIRLFRLLIV